MNEKSNTRARVTMKDVARLAGVSPMSVSRVLAGGSNVAVESRIRIQDAIAKLGYVPDRVAGSLSSRRSGFVAVVLPTIANSNFADTAMGMTEVLWLDGFQPLFGFTMYNLQDEERLVQSFLARRPEAIVLTGDQHTRTMRQLLIDADIPVVEIFSDIEQPIDHAVGFSNEDAGRTAARYLVSLGHTNIGAIAPDGDGNARDRRGEARLSGFSAYLTEVGLPLKNVIKYGGIPFSYESGAESMAHLLDNSSGLDAVFVISDLGAVGALMECQRRGIKVPDELSLIGFGNFEIGRQCVPTLTTVGIDAIGIGRETGKLILQLLADSGRKARADTSDRVTNLGFSLIERQSTIVVSDNDYKKQ